MWAKLSLVFRTIRHLRLIQIYYQFFYRIRGTFVSQQSLGSISGYDSASPVELIKSHFVGNSTRLDWAGRDVILAFLNLSHRFDLNSIDWNYSAYGKLWTYNLNYFDFLFSENVTKETGLNLILNYIEKYDLLKDGLEPYPISLRGINWIKFLSHHKFEDDHVNKSLYRQYHILVSSLEYHLLANHLLENGFSLLFAAYYFRSDAFYDKAKRILSSELKEQLCKDGGHFERSPMYHQVILFRLLDCLNLVKLNTWKNQELKHLLEKKSSMMISWLTNVTMLNGDIPMIKDSAYGIAPTTKMLIQYSKLLNVEALDFPLADSGFRKFTAGKWEVFIDIGEISPGYQPGHSHADELNFLVYQNGNPILVDVGVSTYQIGDRRSFERSTVAHNCVNINNSNSSEVWGGFRVGKRSKVEIISEDSGLIEARHFGYENVVLTRRFSVTSEQVEICDLLEGRLSTNDTAEINLHFYPGLKPEFESQNQIALGNLILNLEGISQLTIKTYKFAAGFNSLKEAYKLNGIVVKKSKIQIHAN